MNLTRPRPPNQDPTRAQLNFFKTSKLTFTYYDSENGSHKIYFATEHLLSVMRISEEKWGF